ncbi:MAG: serine protein kinase RIO [Candidatus Aenigmarchaeota archaeon]|nr:serine protein kinase RIO [Candidatus Aenigmarchaeota archaeon]
MTKLQFEDTEDIKISKGVFDRRTLLTLHNLINKKKIKSVDTILKEGKESNVFLGKDHSNNPIAIKIYRIESCNFKNMWKYLIGDNRFRTVKKDKYFVVNLWCQREFKNMTLAYNANVDVPRPIFCKDNVLVMEFIGDGNFPAPRLIELRTDGNSLYKKIVKDVRKLAKIGLVHGDLSAYNILIHEKPYIIDLSHGMMLSNNESFDLLKRDIQNINKYFSKMGVKTINEEKIIHEIVKERDQK